MSGHSKWANIQHRKGRQDKLRAKVFTRLGKELTIASRIAGGNIEFNPRLRLAVDKAKAANMPKDNIERAIKKGTGELEGVDYLEIRYEGYGAAGVAFIVDVVTENKNRSASTVRMNFSRNEGNLGESGSVSFMFDRKGVIEFDNNIDIDALMEVALEIGAEDIVEKEDSVIVLTDSNDIEQIQLALKEKGFVEKSAEVEMYPKSEIEISDVETARKIMDLYEALEDNEDVQEIYSNFNIPNSIMEELE